MVNLDMNMDMGNSEWLHYSIVHIFGRSVVVARASFTCEILHDIHEVALFLFLEMTSK